MPLPLLSHLISPSCAVAADKDTDEVDNEWFLCPMKITHHQGELVTTGFPVENRLIGQVRAARGRGLVVFAAYRSTGALHSPLSRSGQTCSCSTRAVEAQVA